MTHVTRYYHTCLNCDRATSTIVKNDETRLTFITNDDRVAELVEKCVEKSNIEDLNVVVNQMIAASGDYIDWVKKQTIPLPGVDNYTEVDPFANSTAIATENVSKMANFATGQRFDVEALQLKNDLTQLKFA